MSAPLARPEPAKQLLPFLQRADELQKHDLLVAYFCRLYAMELGLKIPVKERTKATNALLLSLMNQLERDKKIVKLSPEDNLYIEGFALSVFAKADKQDRAGRADLNTAKTFYAASIFFEILHQFGELQPDIEQKAKYSVWKAADIRKALAEGRKPAPGPPVSYQDFGVNALELETEVSTVKDRADFSLASNVLPTSPSRLENRETEISPQPSACSFQAAAFSDNKQGVPHSPYMISSSMSDFPSISQPAYSMSVSLDGQSVSPHFPNFHVPVSSGVEPAHDICPQVTTYPVVAADAMSSTHATSAVPPVQNASPTAAAGRPQPTSLSAGQGLYGTTLPASPQATYQPSSEKIAEAHKAARYAVSALAFDDVTTAVSFLRTSLELLTSPNATIP